jgi:hypothetical protein
MIGDPALRWHIPAIVATFLLAALAAGAHSPRPPVFTADDKGGYTFDTGILRGTLRQNGKSVGLSPVVHIPTGTRLDSSLGIMSHYRVFTANHRYGPAAWDWPGTAALLPDGAVRVTWPHAADRPFEMAGLYRWKDPQTLDVETTVTAREDLSGFEVFLASYFAETFPSPFVYVREHDKLAFLLADRSYGDWQMFPRDAQAVPLIHDGRWKIEPHPVDWAIMPRLAAPLCLRRNTAHGLTAILMSPPTDCFAISTPYEGEIHYSVYLSLFGRDLKAGQTAAARTRLIFTTAIPNEQILALYESYLHDVSTSPR